MLDSRKGNRALYLGWAENPASEAVLTVLKKRFKVVYAGHFRFGEGPDQRKLAAMKADYLFTFGPVLVKERLIRSIQKAAVNFHTGPPEWPGRGSCSFALLHGDKQFGVTAHLLTKEIDAGPILMVRRFPIHLDDIAETLHARTLREIPRLARAVADRLKNSGGQLVPSREWWARKALRMKDMLVAMKIGESDSREIFERKIRAFSYSGKLGPYLVRHGRTFWYMHGKDR
ncbi:MAG: hypothetical protein NC910_01360 [Candidatus Omnitrophica bacterium]|nr:hypothetical protein [Candidatus Omnitrophota bacterium]